MFTLFSLWKVVMRSGWQINILSYIGLSVAQWWIINCNVDGFMIVISVLLRLYFIALLSLFVIWENPAFSIRLNTKQHDNFHETCLEFGVAPPWTSQERCLQVNQLKLVIMALQSVYFVIMGFYVRDQVCLMKFLWVSCQVAIAAQNIWFEIKHTQARLTYSAHWTDISQTINQCYVSVTTQLLSNTHLAVWTCKFYCLWTQIVEGWDDQSSIVEILGCVR